MDGWTELDALSIGGEMDRWWNRIDRFDVIF